MPVENLTRTASQIRRDTFSAIVNAQSGHLGGSFSIIEILTVLYFEILRLRDFAENRDRFILSKGHGVPALYTTLVYKGILEADLLSGLRRLESPLQGHPDARKVFGLEATSGSLGQGLSIGVGIALGQARRNFDSRTFVLLGDGELNEGQIWEAAMAAVHFKLKNLIAIVDNNGLQLDGKTDEIMSLGDLKVKWESFGWNVEEADGHCIDNLIDAFKKVEISDRPSVIIAKTVKGKGVSFMENKVQYHGAIPDTEQCAQAMAELEGEVLKWQK